MIVPPQNDSLWEDFIAHINDFQFQSFAVRMMHSRLKSMLRSEDSDPEEAIRIAHEFFSTNIENVQDDFQTLLNKRKKQG